MIVVTFFVDHIAILDLNPNSKQLSEAVENVFPDETIILLIVEATISNIARVIVKIELSDLRSKPEEIKESLLKALRKQEWGNGHQISLRNLFERLSDEKILITPAY